MRSFPGPQGPSLPSECRLTLATNVLFALRSKPRFRRSGATCERTCCFTREPTTVFVAIRGALTTVFFVSPRRTTSSSHATPSLFAHFLEQNNQRCRWSTSLVFHAAALIRSQEETNLLAELECLQALCMPSFPFLSLSGFKLERMQKGVEYENGTTCPVFVWQ